MDIRRYKDSIRTLAYIILLTAVNYFIPFLSMAVMILWPVPIVYLVQKKKSSGVIEVIIIAALINGLLFGTVMGLMTIIGFGLVGFVIGNVIKEGLSPFKTLIISVIAVAISQLLIFYVASGMLNLNYQTLLQQALQNLSGELDQQSVEQIISTQFNLIRMIFPSLLVISATITGILNYYVSAWYLRRRGLNIELYKPVSRWYLPRWVVSILIVVSLLLTSNPVFININIFMFFLAFLQGFAVLMYFLSKKNSSILIKSFLIFLIFVFPPIPIILILLGLLDMWFNFRKQSNQPG
ncbi:DUF2232 domain-containing protein [Halanaerobium congolense]|jgi:uncharacterized protein YybS (DUF2232 family)|uniref:Uncharacterized conserved protein YybS, DUF2232 family n=1 Tax=Halanaerobium congolense TaxID=54121 RepID=A0A1G6IMB0_9FIRM|nr:DUF2232 domain-containing protein [Halanaerobium congolense]KXS50370.1 MAG: hypothetical protein AWL62_194 [Halanaerobium sp. T82-1]PUU92371.1 MAG: hypothetical protein CI948_705 [Halanaerobium sp.]PTX15928.1 uncharacterized protein YybS (DUF2232 family) [Halanaerobium congolense]TDS33875.1 uncharacterized protein YybS (DUF2232 family) [Halanaerobium congolense]TDX44457.1 uncharacterized protein YybS (DUF2232 family) [Halanaerobium congolense]